MTPSSASTPSALRFADAEPDPLAPHERAFVVLEDHSAVPAERKEPENCLAVVSLATGEISKIVRGSDFYSSPRPSPDGKRIAWVEWVRSRVFQTLEFGGRRERRGRRGKREKREGGGGKKTGGKEEEGKMKKEKRTDPSPSPLHFPSSPLSKKSKLDHRRSTPTCPGTTPRSSSQT